MDTASQEREIQVTRLARRGFIALQRPKAVALLLSLLRKLGGSGSPGQLLQQQQTKIFNLVQSLIGGGAENQRKAEE